MAKQKSEDAWRRADEGVRKNLPPGVKLVRTLRGHRFFASLRMTATMCTDFRTPW